MDNVQTLAHARQGLARARDALAFARELCHRSGWGNHGHIDTFDRCVEEVAAWEALLADLEASNAPEGHTFALGDRVRFTGHFDDGCFDIPAGTVGTLTNLEDGWGYILVKLDNTELSPEGFDGEVMVHTEPLWGSQVFDLYTVLEIV